MSAPWLLLPAACCAVFALVCALCFPQHVKEQRVFVAAMDASFVVASAGGMWFALNYAYWGVLP